MMQSLQFHKFDPLMPYLCDKTYIPIPAHSSMGIMRLQVPRRLPTPACTLQQPTPSTQQNWQPASTPFHPGSVA